MDVEQLRKDVHAGRITPDRLIDLIVTLQRRNEELERQLKGGSPPKISEPFSVEAEERRQEARGRKRRRRKQRSGGRISTAEKIAQAVRTEKVFPAGVRKADCRLSHTRVAWRLEDGQAVLVAYDIYRGPKNQYGKIPGVFGRSEFGAEIVLAIAYQVYVVGLSFDKVCLLMNFFQHLTLRKSQADALLNQLARQWEEEFELLCLLLANSLVVHTDETGWSINSVWAFLSEKVRVLFFGVHKDAETLRQILDPAIFAGLVISDDAAVYANFTQSQKCWAHFLRKAIKLTLMEPANAEYRQFTDRLLEIYREACRVQHDRRLSGEGRKGKVAVLEDEVLELCALDVGSRTAARRRARRRLSAAVQRTDAGDAGGAALHVCHGGAGGEAQRGSADRVGNEQRSRTDATLSGASAGHGPHQQDGGWRAAANGNRQRAGIAPPISFHLYAIERHRGNPALVRNRPQLFRPLGGEAWVDR